MKEFKPSKKPILTYYLVIFLIIISINSWLWPIFRGEENTVKEMDYSNFMTLTEQQEIDKVQIEQDQIIFTKKGEKQAYKTAPIHDPQLVDRLHKANADFTGKIVTPMNPLLNFALTWILPILIFFGIGHYMNKRIMNRMGGQGAMQFGMGKSNAKIYVKPTDGIKFADVAGEDEAKDSLKEVVSYLHDPSKYKDIGAKMPKGILLVGPPGTGKTMLAKAVAGESGVPFFSISGSEFVEMFVGMGAAKVRDLFKQAKEKAPCIVFIDEIDAIGKKRGGAVIGGNDEREQTLNQLLTEMDGFEENTGVIILAATNRPESLDPALTRPGRFDRQVPVALPDLQGREEILKVHAQKIKTAPAIDYNKVARMASGASGAELANIINEAALRAVRDHRPYATQEDMEASIEVVIAGYEKKHAILTDKEKCVVSYHEIGHALVAALQSHTAPVQKITIIPRTSGALGYTMQVEEGNDIEKATRLARAMITRFGMSDEFGMVAMENVQNQYLGGDTTLACSPETQARIDRAVSALIGRQHKKAITLLTENRKKLDDLAKHLYEKETITGEEFMEILNREMAEEKGEPSPAEEPKEEIKELPHPELNLEK